MSTELRKVKPLDEQSEFVLSFIQDSEETRSPLEDIWDEVDDNYLVRPPLDQSLGTAYPLDASLVQTMSGRSRVSSILKDPETHQEIMTILASIALNVFPVGGGFVAARSVGFEDIIAATAVNGLTEHAFRLPGHFWAKVNQILMALLHGTGVGCWNWRYTEEARSLRTLQVDPLSGDEEFTEQILMVPTWDDPNFRVKQTRDFYPDHGQEMIRDMAGAAEHFRITAMEALRLARAGVYDQAAVEEAIERRSGDVAKSQRPSSVDDVGAELASHPDFMQMDGYTYYGETPFLSPGEEKEEDGIARRVITSLQGITVRSRPWPRPLPYTEIKIIPRPGSFWGIGVGEVVRYDQDFADTMKMMLADATVRTTHPSFIYDKNAGVELGKLRRFNPRVPIGADSVNAVQTLNYSPNLSHAFGMYSGVKSQMRDASSALDALQGQSGPDREAATVGSLRYKAAQARPELFAQVLEREWLPEDGRIVLSLYQEFLPDDDELLKRIGQSNIPVALADIMGDFDIEFMGSRQHANRVQKLEAFREIVAAGANPIIQQINPWIPLLRKFYKDMGAEDIATMVGNPGMVQIHTMLTQMGGGPPNTAQMPTSASPPGLLPEQASGMVG